MAPAKELARGISEGSRSDAYKRRRVWAVKKKNGGKFPSTPKAEKPAAPVTTGRFYPAEDVKKPLRKRITRRPTKLRATITPGTVLILLAGRFKGKRVVFLKQLESGLLLVTGPFKVNGVPARRVNQAYVIATSTKVELPSDLDTSKFTDAFFKGAAKDGKKKAKAPGDGKDVAMFQEEQAQPAALAPEYVAAQKALDAALLPAVAGDLKGYLATRFSLGAGDRPHLLKF